MDAFNLPIHGPDSDNDTTHAVRSVSDGVSASGQHDTAASANSARMPGRRRIAMPLLIIGALIVFGGAGAAWYWDAGTPLALLGGLGDDNQEQEQQDDQPLDGDDQLIQAVSQLVLLPEGEEPVIATVAQPNLLEGQEFFANAKQGDKVLIYAQARKAFLYDPIANIVLNIGPVFLEQENTEADAPPDAVLQPGLQEQSQEDSTVPSGGVLPQ